MPTHPSSAREEILLGSFKETGDERDYKDGQEYIEQNFSNFCGSSGDAAKTKNGRNDCNDQKNTCVP
jgi:hypothetical protein